MSQYRFAGIRDITPRAVPTLGFAFIPPTGVSHYLEFAPHRTEVDGHLVFTDVLPKRSRTDLPRDADTLDANLYKIN